MIARVIERRVGLLLAGVGTAALGAVGLWKARDIREPSGYQAIGPAMFPSIVCLCLLALGVAFVSRIIVRPDRDLLRSVAAEQAESELRTPLLLVAGLVAYAFVLPEVGYVVATAGFFPVAARLLGSERSVRDAAIGVALSIVLFELFTQLLGVRLPAGPLAGIL